MGKCKSRECLAAMPQFGSCCPEEFAANGRVVKKVPNVDARSQSATAGRDLAALSPGDFQFRSSKVLGGPATDKQVAHGRDRCEGLAAKAERPNVE